MKKLQPGAMDGPGEPPISRSDQAAVEVCILPTSSLCHAGRSFQCWPISGIPIKARSTFVGSDWETHEPNNSTRADGPSDLMLFDVIFTCS